MRTILVAILASSACGSTPPVSRPSKLTALGTTHDTSNTEPLPVDTAPAAEPSPDAMRLLAATMELEVGKPHLDHDRVVRALRTLADVLGIIAPTKAAETARLREATERLAQSDPHATSHAAFVRTAFDSATAVLNGMPTSARTDLTRYQAAVGELRDDTLDISPDRPLLDQYAEVRAAMRAAVRAVYAADGVAEPSFEEKLPTARR